MRFSPHPLPFLFDAKSRTTRIIAWEIAQLYTLKKMGTYDWLSVKPRGNTGSRNTIYIYIYDIYIYDIDIGNTRDYLSYLFIIRFTRPSAIIMMQDT